MPIFLSTVNAASRLGMMPRKFRRVADAAKVQGVKIGAREVLMWTLEHVRQIHNFYVREVAAGRRGMDRSHPERNL